MLSRMKIRKKLMTGFICIGLFSLVVGAFGLIYIGKTNDGTDRLYEKHFKPSAYLFTVHKNMLLIGSDYLLMLNEKDASKVAERVEGITAWRNQNRELLLKYESAGFSEKEKEIYENMQEDLEAYEKLSKELDKLLLENNFEEAAKLAPSFNQAGEAADTHMKELVDAGQAAAESAVRKSDQDFRIASVVMIIAALAALALACILALFISGAISKPLNRLVSEAKKLSVGDVDVNVETDLRDEVGELMKAFGGMAENIRLQAEAAERIAAGDFSLEISPRSDKDRLGASMVSVLNTLNSIAGEAAELTKAAFEGDLDFRSNTEKFSGGYREIVEGFNRTLDAIMTPLNTALPYIKAMANGDDTAPLENSFKGQYAALIDNLNLLSSSLYALLRETGKLEEAAADGNLSYRADISTLNGNYARIVQGINQTLDSLIIPLNMAGGCIERIGKGEIPEKITEEYRGEYDKIRNSINACIDGLEALVEGNEVMSRMSMNDYSAKVEGTYLGIYDELSKSINLVNDRMNRVMEILTHISAGDLSDLENIKASGKRCDNDQLVPCLILLIETIKELYEETDVLWRAAMDGQLDFRGDSKKFKGQFEEIIEGINETMDAVTAPIQEALAVLKEVAKGNLHIAVNGDYKGDYAAIKNTLNETIQILSSYVNEISGTLSEIAAGNLNLAVTADYRGDFVEIKDSLNHIVSSLNLIMGEISNASEEVASGSRQVSDGSQTLSQGSTEQASSIQELTASMAEVASQTKQNAINANQASEIAVSAKDKAIRGNGQMHEMLNSMAEINASSANISKIIKVIDDIAFQTNILALNAAVEAARAGQHGKGFAVVAEEVRSLAARSAEAARETTDLIEGSVDKVQTGTRIANDTASALTEIVTEIERAAGLIGGIANSSNEQASGIAQINKGIEQVSMVVQNNSATAEESAAASEELSGQAELLRAMVGKFQLNRRGKALPGGNPRLNDGSSCAAEAASFRSEEPNIMHSAEGHDKY